MMRLTILAASLLAVLTPPALARDQLVIGATQFPSTLNPNLDAMLAKSYVLGLTQRPITAYDQDWKLVCFLCTKLPTIENGLAKIEDLPPALAAERERQQVCKTRDPALVGKGIAATYTLQPDATWGDGTPVTTDDVMFTYAVGKNEQSGVINSELYRRILKIDVVDKKTFTMHFDRVEAGYNGINDFHLLPAHLERQAFADPAQYRNRTLFVTDPTNPGLWFGPYRVTRLEPGAVIELAANPTWWGEKPQIPRIVIKTIENSAALEANLLSGAVDYVAGELGFSIDQALAFEARHKGRYDFLYKPVLFFEHLTPNLDNPIFADKRVRQALLYALDREALTQQLFAGHQPVADTSVSPLDWVHTDEVKKYPYDPKRAAALLDAAGWTLGPDGVRRNAKGERLSFELMTTAGERTRELVEQVLQSQWRQVGVEARIRNEPARVFFGETISKRKFTGLALFAWLSPPENVPRTTLHSTMVPSAANGWAGQNYADYRNPKLDALIDCMEVELDDKKREAMWHELQRIYAEDLPDLPLFFRAQAFILPKWLKGVTPTGHLGPSTLWAEHWRIVE